MADNITILTQDGQRDVATHDKAGVHHQRNIVQAMASGAPVDLAATQDNANGDWSLSVRDRQLWQHFAFETISTAQTYAVGDSVGGTKTKVVAGFEEQSIYVESITVVDGDNVGPDLTVMLTTALGLGATDGAAFAPSAENLRSALGGGVLAEVGGAEYVTLNSIKVARVPVGQHLVGPWDNFYLDVVAGVEYVAAGANLSVLVTFRRD